MKARSLNRLGRKVEALDTCQKGREVIANDPELLYLEGQLQRETGNYTGAESLYLQLLGLKPEQHFASIDPSITGYKARHQLAVIYHLQQRFEEAEQQWKLVTQEQSGFLPAWLGLAEIYLRTNEMKLDEVIEQLQEIPEGKVEAEVLRVRLLLQRQDFSGAKEAAELAIERYPEEIEPRVVMSHVLLQEGSNLQAAEDALREILKRDPQHREALNNLSVLLHQQNRSLNEVFSEVEGSIDELMEKDQTEITLQKE